MVTVVEAGTDKICVHSDYVPVKTSSCYIGNTLYWADDTMEKHKLLHCELQWYRNSHRQGC